MCGIVGYGGFTKKNLLDKAIKEIHHRGPDDNGAAYFDGIALGNTRLAIIDLSPKGHQPMFNVDKSLCITFNGEIYNFKEVKRLLEKKYEFQSNSDTEVILYAYKEWGSKCLEKLNGMFSFVIYDRKNKLLFGARDRLGQKPLKYYFKDGEFIFASETKAIFSLLKSSPDIDSKAIDDFLTFQYVPAPATGFKDIYKLPAGHYFIYQDKKLSVHKYWSINFTKKLTLSENEWRELVFSEIERSVRSHLISDVPVGALLSGGLDSSIVVALMAKNSSRRINTFSIAFDDNRFDETRYAKIVSEKYQTIHTSFTVTSKELLDNMANLVNIFDEPIADNSILPTSLVSQLASRKVKVALTGDGGDESFAGYDRYTFVNIANLIAKSPTIFKKTALFPTKIALQLYPHKQIERIHRFFLTLDDTFYRKYVNYNSFFTNKVKAHLYTNEFKEKIKNNDSYNIYSGYYEKKLSDLDNALKIDINTYLPNDLLYKSDSASMACGLELRSPFLDHLLMEKMAAMPSSMKIRLLNKKTILKNIASDYNLLPKEIIYRKKQGFNTPQNKWFKGPLKKYITEQILTSKMIGLIFDRDKMEKYLDDYFRKNLNYDNNIFALLMLSSWTDKYFL